MGLPIMRWYRASNPAAVTLHKKFSDGALPVAGLGVLEFAKTLHQIEELAVDLNRINRRPALEPLAPTPSVVSASLSKGRFS